MKKKLFITVAIDSPAAAGAGTQAKLIAKHYNLYYLDTGKIYRYIGLLRINNKNNFSYTFIKKKINKLNPKILSKRSLLLDNVALSAATIAKKKKLEILCTCISKNVHIIPQKNILVQFLMVAT